MCFNLHEELQAILYCAKPQASVLTNGGVWLSFCEFTFKTTSSSHSVAFLPFESHMENHSGDFGNYVELYTIMMKS